MNSLFFLYILTLPLSAVNSESGKLIVPPGSDTIVCTTNVKSNLLNTDSLLADSTTAEIFTPLLNGTITQKGLNNTIEINTGLSHDSTKQVRRNKVSVTQTGRNNTVKIKSQVVKKRTKHSSKTNKK